MVVLASDGSLLIYENPRDWKVAPSVVSVIPGLAGCRGDALHGGTYRLKYFPYSKIPECSLVMDLLMLLQAIQHLITLEL